MRSLSRAVVILALLPSACSRQEPTPAPSPGRSGAADSAIEQVLAATPTASNQERYDAALIDALNLLADRKLPQALNAVRAAQAIQDTEQVRQLAARIERLTAEQAAAEKITQDLRNSMSSGRADEVARLGTSALSQYGGSEAAPELVRVQQEAQALVLASAQDKADQWRRLQGDAQAALRDNNLRAAAICLEQALPLRDDPLLRQQLDDVHARLARYDEARQRAQSLRRDPARLEDAVAALREAASAWDTLEIRQEMDDYNLALQNRRERLSVVAFEGDGDVGILGLGRALADDLLPVFKARFDLTEREQVGRVLQELKLEGTALTALPQAGQDFARLAGVRYLVVGNLSPLDGITASARLVDVRTGLIVQTARVSAPTPNALRSRLPALGQMLLMNDEQKMAFELAQAQRALEIQAIVPVQVVPPPPVFTPDQLPPPVITFTARPPALGGLTVADFTILTPVVAVPPPPPQLVIVREEPRRRLFALSLELGDNLFRRGRHQEARRHFELALSLTSDRAAIDLRIERCRQAPPPPVVVVQAPPRLRLAVFNFVVNAQPGFVPPACGDWAADQCAAQFGPTYEIVDRGEVCWYMGRLGFTMRDVVTDASCRLALAQAMNVRFFAYGTIEQTASLNVTTHLIDAQTGARTGSGMIHVQDHNEMKLRMGELTKQVTAPPAEQARLAQQSKENERALNEARRLMKANQYAQASAVAQQALQKTPNDVALRSIEQQAQEKARLVALAEAQRRDAEARKTAAAAAEQRQRELVRQAEAARLRAETEAKARGDAARQEQARQKAQAAEQLRAQARTAQKQGNYNQAVQALQSALALNSSDEVKRELAQARAEQEKATRLHAEQKALADQVARKAAQDAAQARLAAQRRQQEAADAERKRVEEKTRQDQLAAAARQKQAQGVLEAQRKMEETRRQRAASPPQPPPAPLSRPPAAQSPPPPPSRPTATQPQNTTPAPSPQAKYREAMQSAAALEKQGRFSDAAAAYRTALKVMPNDAAATAALRNADFRGHMAEGQKLLAARKSVEAAREFEAAVNLDPRSNEARTLLQKARSGKQ